MQLGPMPGTKLYRDYERHGKLIEDLPYESQHGQGKIWFQHDHFTRDESKELLRLAFEIDYNRNGASLLRAIKTTFQGYTYYQAHSSELIRGRSAVYKDRLKMMRSFLTALTLFVQNHRSEILSEEIKKLFHLHFGGKNIPAFIKSIIVVFFSTKEYLRCRIFGDVRTLKTSYRLYRVLKNKEQLYKFSDFAATEHRIAYSSPETKE